MYLPLRSTALLLLFLLLCGTATAQTTVTLTPAKDNTLYESTAGNVSNGQGRHLFAGRTNQGSLRRALFAFDVAGALPAGATVDAVTLTLNMSRTNSAGGTHTFGLHRVTEDWGEGASAAGGNEGSGAPAASGDATWLHGFFNTSLWSSPGGAFVGGASATASVGGFGAYTWGSSPQMVADVQAWLADPTGNFGWIVVGGEENSASTKRFDSRALGTGPSLSVTFTTATATEDAAEIPDAARLAQNYPNPFRRATTITYTLARPQQVTLHVFDVQGRRVETLVDAWQGAGTHAVPFDATALPRGVYLYRLASDRALQHRTMIVF